MSRILLLWIAALFINLMETQAVSAPPNILLIIADDMLWQDCEPYGNDAIRTPNLSRLAKEGICFDNCFTATAMCSPTRQQLYTGIFPVRNGAYPNHSRVYPGTKSLVHHFQDLGYRVGLAGKSHVGPPKSFPFEKVGNSKSGDDDPHAIARFVEQDKSQPFFLTIASNEPHTPWNKGPQEEFDPETLSVPPFLADTPETRTALQQYYAEIRYLDGQVGSCLRVLDEANIAENTIVLFTSEQGLAFPFGKWTCYDTGLKTALIVRWPGHVAANTRTSAMVEYVDIVPTLLEAVGVDPTQIDTGRPGASDGGSGFDGRSFLSVLQGEADEHRDYVYGVHTTRGIINGTDYPIRSVRNRRYKLIRNLNHDHLFSNVLTKPDGMIPQWLAGDDRAAERARQYQQRPSVEFYDLESDPWELNNLADNIPDAKAYEDLQSELDSWMAQQGDEGMATEMRANQRKGNAQKQPQKKNTRRKNNRQRTE